MTPALHSTQGAGHGVAMARHVDDPAMSATMRPALEAAGMQTVWWAQVVPADSEQAVAALVSFHRHRRPPSAHALRAAEIGCTLVAIALERHAAVTELAHRELHDGLTGLPNRTLLLDRLQTALDRAQRTSADVGVRLRRPRPVQARQRHLGHVAGDAAAVRGGRAPAPRRRAPTTPSPASAPTSSSWCCDRPRRRATVVALADRLRAPSPSPSRSRPATSCPHRQPRPRRRSTPGVDAADACCARPTRPCSGPSSGAATGRDVRRRPCRPAPATGCLEHRPAPGHRARRAPRRTTSRSST